MNDLLVGLDLGTSAVKAGLFDAAGQLRRLAWREYPVYSPRPGWVEQEPQEWWEAACAALQEVLSEVGDDQIAALGLCGQTPGHVLVAAGGQSLGRAIIWRDRRATAEAAWMAREFRLEEMEQFTGLALPPDSALPPARLLWLQRHRPEEWSRARWVLQPKDYLAFRLTGQAATDPLSAYGLIHLHRRHYLEEYLHRLGLSAEKVPPALSPAEVVGVLAPAAAEATGLPAGTPVVTGTIDAWCNVLGAGGVTEGQAVDVAGTSEIVALVGRPRRAVAGIASMPLLGELAFIGGPTQIGANALRWMGRILCPGEEENVYGLLEREAAKAGPGADGVLFLPYLAGERTPLWDECACGAFVGCRQEHGRMHLARAVYEGVALAVRHILTLAEETAGLSAVALRVCGGGSRSRFWNQLKADVTGRQVLELEVAETAVLGAAMWAAVATGLHRDVATAAAHMVRVKAELPPDLSLQDRYDELAILYRALYPALQEVFGGLATWRSRYQGEGNYAHP